MTQTRQTDVESGTNGSPFLLDTPAQGASGFSPNCTNLHAAHGTKSVVELGSGSYQYLQANFPIASTTWRVRYAIGQDTQITNNPNDFELHSDITSIGATNRALSVQRISSGILRIVDAAGTLKSFVTVMPTDGSFLVLEMWGVCGTSANAVLHARLYRSDAPTVILETFDTTTATTTATVMSAHLGKITTGAYTPSTGKTWHDDFYFDDATGSFIGPVATPVASAGAAQVHVEPYTVVTLDGSGSLDTGGLTFTYNWTQTSGPTLSGFPATVQSPTFTAPPTPDPTTYGFQLVTTNSAGTVSVAATTSVQVAAHTMWLITNPVGPVLTPIRLSIV